MGRQQSVTELIRVEPLGEPRHMPRRMVFDVDLPPWARPPCGNAGVDPEFPGDPAAIRDRCRARILRGFGLLGNTRCHQCSYARSGGRLQEAATICRLRHGVDSCEQAMKMERV